MQSSAGTDLPHTRARTVHWLTTAAALAVVTGAAALVQPSNATAGQDSATADGPDPVGVAYPLDCGPLPTAVDDRATVDLDADGQAETVAVVRCDAGSGTPPHGMYLLTHRADEGGTPRVAATLVDPGEGMNVDRLAIRDGAIEARLFGYSSADVPRCCPDMRRDVSWDWRDGRLELHVGRVPNSV